MRQAMRTRRVWLLWSGAAIAFIAFLIALAYAYEMPGGIADWRYSRAAGLPGTMRIPIGRTAEEALRKQMQIDPDQIVYRENRNGGALLLVKKRENPDATGLQMEFVRKTWLGWKWSMGGGYGISIGKNGETALSYWSMPRYRGIRGPFPIVFGTIVNPSITAIQLKIGGTDAERYPGKVISFREPPGSAENLRGVWFAVIPEDAAAPYTIQAINGQGATVASQTFNKLDDPGTVRMGAKASEKP